MGDVKNVTDEEVYKAIGHLDSATEVMQHNHEIDSKNEDQVLTVISFIGQIIKALIAK